MAPEGADRRVPRHRPTLAGEAGKCVGQQGCRGFRGMRQGDWS